jgi:spore germination protein YaaH
MLVLIPLMAAAQVAGCANRFLDDDSSVFEDDVAALAAAAVTAGCNPPVNDRFCPDDAVTRGQMAAFLSRALRLEPAPGVDFVDDGGSVFEDDIGRLAAAGITRGCNPPVNDRFCPDDTVTRGQMAAFLSRARLADPEPSPETREVVVTLSEVERLAADRGVSVAVLSGGCRLGSVDRRSPRTTVAAPPGELRFAYVTPAGVSTDVTWTATPVDGDAGAEQPWREQAPPTPSRALAWQSGGDRSQYRAEIDAAAVDVVSPLWWYVQPDGTVSSGVDAGYVADVHARGRSIWPAIAGYGPALAHALLADPAGRSAVARRISDEARAAGVDGVNLDIEGVGSADADALTAFAAEVAELVHEWGGVVSFDLRPRFDTLEGIAPGLAFWETSPDRREISAAVDLTVLMTYDEYHRLRPGGPVASPGWVLDTLVYQLRYTDPHELMLGIPFYGRVWDPDDLDSPTAVTMSTLERLAAEGISTFDPEQGLARVDLADGRYLYDEGTSVIADRVQLVEEYGLAGWAAWRLGFDSAALWAALGG